MHLLGRSQVCVTDAAAYRRLNHSHTPLADPHSSIPAGTPGCGSYTCLPADRAQVETPGETAETKSATAVMINCADILHDRVTLSTKKLHTVRCCLAAAGLFAGICLLPVLLAAHLPLALAAADAWEATHSTQAHLEVLVKVISDYQIVSHPDSVGLHGVCGSIIKVSQVRVIEV